jgi:hypothetical protein
LGSFPQPLFARFSAGVSYIVSFDSMERTAMLRQAMRTDRPILETFALVKCIGVDASFLLLDRHHSPNGTLVVVRRHVRIAHRHLYAGATWITPDDGQWQTLRQPSGCGYVA